MNGPLDQQAKSPTAGDLAAVLALPSPAATDAERIDRIAVMERLKAGLAAAQARETVAFKSSQLAANQAAGVPVRRRGVGIVDQVALARGESPAKTERLFVLADALAGQLSHTAAAMSAGVCSEYRAMLLTRETTFLSDDHRREVDARLAADLLDTHHPVGPPHKPCRLRQPPHGLVTRGRRPAARTRHGAPPTGQGARVARYAARFASDEANPAA